jgi:Tol biopolymer transport system component
MSTHSSAKGGPSRHPVARASTTSTPPGGKLSPLSLIRTVKPPNKLSLPLRPRGLVGLITVLACMALAGLTPSVLAAGSCPNEQVRAEAHSVSLPDCRAYELVTPPYKEGHPIVLGNSLAVSTGGSRLIATSFGAFAGTEDVPPGEGFASGALYEFSRTVSGWLTTPLAPPASQFAEDAFLHQLVSSDFNTTTFVLTTPSQFIQQRDLYLRTPSGSFVRVGPMTPPQAPNNNDANPVGGSADLSHVLFFLAQSRWPGDTTAIEGGSGANSLYEAVLGRDTGEPKLVGVKNEGLLASNREAQLISQCGVDLGAGGESSSAVSSSGSTVYFTARGKRTGFCGNRLKSLAACEAEGKTSKECEETIGPPFAGPDVSELYARVEGSRTVAISEPMLAAGQCSGACAAAEHQEGVFQGASEDGSKVFFLSAQPLLNSDTDLTNDLYEAEITSTGVKKLLQISRGDASDATPGAGASVLSVAGIARDGARAYFVAQGILTTAANSEGQKAAALSPNLYVVDTATGATRFVTTLAASEAESARVTPDGRFLVYVNAGQVFEYDAQTATLIRVAGSGAGPRVSNDGAYVAFQSSASLTPQAVSGTSHVYEYHSGALSLISDGQDAQGEGARLTGMDASGENIFFETVDPLVSQDTDTQVDYYDARIDGGFPAVATLGGCSGDGCQGSSRIAPSTLAAGTLTQPAEGNLTPPAAAKPKSTKRNSILTRAQKLARALKACRAKHNRHQRAVCEAHARRTFGRKAQARKSSHYLVHGAYGGAK